LAANERVIVEGDLGELDSLIRKLDYVPTLAGRTPRELDARKRAAIWLVTSVERWPYLKRYRL
jgi:hypothetical protein